MVKNMDRKKASEKASLRRLALSERKSLDPKLREEKNRIITEEVINHPVFLRADILFVYANTEFEVSTREIIKTAWKAGKKTAVPRVCDKRMDFFYIHSFSDLQSSPFGVPEPKDYCQYASPKGKLLMIVPGVAFDLKRNRIGYGGGYYDRYLKRYPDLYSIALAYAVQVKEHIPADDFDIKPNLIITETSQPI